MLGIAPVWFRDEVEKALWSAPEALELLRNFLLVCKGLEIPFTVMAEQDCVLNVAAELGFAPQAAACEGSAPGDLFAACRAALGRLAGETAEQDFLVANFRYPLLGTATLASARERCAALSGQSVFSAIEVRDHPCQSVAKLDIRAGGLLALADPGYQLPGPGRNLLCSHPLSWGARVVSQDVEPGTLYAATDSGGLAPWRPGGEDLHAPPALYVFESPDVARFVLPWDKAREPDLLGWTCPGLPESLDLRLYGRMGGACRLVARGGGLAPGWLSLHFIVEDGRPVASLSIASEQAVQGATLPSVREECRGLLYAFAALPEDNRYNCDVRIVSPELWGTSPFSPGTCNHLSGKMILGRQDFVPVFEKGTAFIAFRHAPSAMDKPGSLLPVPVREAECVKEPFDIVRCTLLTDYYRRNPLKPFGS